MSTRFFRVVRSALVGIAMVVWLCAIDAQAANVIIVNLDQAGVGLNDPTSATPEGGNTGTTRGQQRMILFQRVAAIWGARLTSAVPIRVGVQFAGNFSCAQNPGDFVYLAYGGPASYYTSNASVQPHPLVYPAALRNAIDSVVTDPSTPEIHMQVSPLMDAQPGCISGTTGFWYGIDPSIAPSDASGKFPILPLILHEVAHGLGFLEGHNLQNGSGFPPYWYIFDTYLYDNSLQKLWTILSNQQVMFSSTNDPNLIWKGPYVDASKSTYLRSPLRLRIGVNAQAGEVAQAYYGPLLPSVGLSSLARLVNDGSANGAEGCNALINGAQVQGRIAVVNRGTCGFSTKTRNAAQAGAIAVLILNNRAETPSDPLPVASSYDFSIGIPTATAAYQTGLDLLSQLSATPNVGIAIEPIPANSLMGTQAGFTRLHAPAVLAISSSVSHFTEEANVPLLMQPEIKPALFDRLDLTPELLQDIGWTILPDDRIFRNGFD